MTGGVSEEPPSPAGGISASGRRTGRRVAQVIYYAVAAAVATAACWQITMQVFFVDGPEGTIPYKTCEEGLRGLYASIDRGRELAEDYRPDERLEEDSLRRYRAWAERSWRWRDQVQAMCQGSRHEALLDALEQLRYSEEHGVRQQAGELSALRRRVRRLVAEQL